MGGCVSPARPAGICATIVSQLSVAAPPIPICIGPAAPAELAPDSTPVPGPLSVPNVDSALLFMSAVGLKGVRTAESVEVGSVSRAV